MAIKVLDGARVYILMYYDPDEDPCICDIYASKEKAREEARRRNKQYCEPESLTEDGDFNSDDYDSCEYCYYDVLTYTLVL